MDGKLAHLYELADKNHKIIEAFITDLEDSEGFEYSRHLTSAKFGRNIFSGV